MKSAKYLRLTLPIIKIVTDGFIVGFAIWTIVAHLVIWFDLPFNTLAALGFLPLLTILIWFYTNRGTGDYEVDGQAAPTTITTGEVSRGLKLIFLITSVILTTAFHSFNDNYALIWLATIVFFLISWLAHRKIPTWQPNLTAKINHTWHLGLILLAIILVLGTVIFTSRSDEDDSRFINMAVSALDHPDDPVYANDTLHNMPGAELLPVYYVHSYELLLAALSRLTTITPMVIAHFWLSLLAAFLAVLAIARLMFLLLPKSGAIATLLVVLILLLLRNTHWIYGNFAFVRIFQGKAWFVTIIVPLIVTYAVQYFTNPTPRRWLLLAFSQIAAIGLTTNALYAAPIVAGLTLCCCWQLNRSLTIRFFKALSASLYTILMGLLIYGAVQATDLDTVSFGPEPEDKIVYNAAENEAETAEVDETAVQEEVFEELNDIVSAGFGWVSFLLYADYRVEEVFNLFFGRGNIGWLWLYTLIGGWVWVLDHGLRRWVLTYSALFVGLFLSPYWDEYLTQYLTGYNLVWRLLWAIPLPAFMALWVHQVFHSTVRFNRVTRYALQAGLAIILAVVVVQTIQNDKKPLVISTHPIILKVPEQDYEIAQEIVRRAKQPKFVLAPSNISPWITTFSNHPYPLVARTSYLWQTSDYFKSNIHLDDLNRRMELFFYISGIGEANVDLLEDIQYYDPQVIVVNPSNPWEASIRDVLVDNGYCASSYEGYEFYEKRDVCS